jgi:hypothetical protein
MGFVDSENKSDPFSEADRIATLCKHPRSKFLETSKSNFENSKVTCGLRLQLPHGARIVTTAGGKSLELLAKEWPCFEGDVDSP